MSSSNIVELSASTTTATRSSSKDYAKNDSKSTSIIMRPLSWLCSFFALSESNRERLVLATDISKTLLHYGWMPLILLIGYYRSDPRPSLFRIINPLATIVSILIGIFTKFVVRRGKWLTIPTQPH